MADAQISRVVIPCFCIQENNIQFISPTGVIGKILNVPCKDSLIDEDLFWCVPVKDEGMFTAWQFILAVGENIVQPTFDSFYVQRVKDKLTNYTWWIYVLTKDDFKNSCNTCCGAATIPMPATDGLFQPIIAPCQLICDIQTVGGDLQALFAIPSLPAGYEYYITGSYNNAQLPLSVTSFATIAALLIYINANWTNVGSPNVTFVWTVSLDGITLTATGGNSGDILCVYVYTIAPSP